ncbi:MAG: GNAT family N-acetyltransferase [Bacteroidetes bacterium]|nr:GNAT family N-acetyltransferase [Bacteroidota bacterium]
MGTKLYPSRQIFEDDINNGWLYGYYEGAELCGCIVLNNVQSPEYADITWKRPDANPLVIHRMCVAPSWQGKGIAKQLLSFAESFASANNHSSIRLDAFIHNPLATRLYIRNDYEKRGQVRFRKGEFYCFEKIIC